MPGMEPALLLRHAPYKAIDLWLLFASLAISILLVTQRPPRIHFQAINTSVFFQSQLPRAANSSASCTTFLVSGVMWGTAISSSLAHSQLSLAYDIGDSQEGLFSKPLSQHHGQQSHHGDQHARKEGSHASGNGVSQLDRSYKRRVLIYRLAFLEYGSADHLALRSVDTSLEQQWRCFFLHS
ncbi:hypothetical protein CIHG_04295 [Coccidioides immitis H538.4]|uniref:Uncharacterized protein n=3 Tax=Coccidioides immitis TaxID=5501 RepID=A0A0J8R7Z7_COCIT|nr:hypothetical protein CIRG_09227 [Coccidioides immitis RMSCC 2394]KMU81114.1 hypothetical protein CISG_02492 [Coccidioides immitis RMSCC 3703]KMU86506.1 hypothetical protein CIHG_04295 [Coccidioides immitis H538.4]